MYDLLMGMIVGVVICCLDNSDISTLEYASVDISNTNRHYLWHTMLINNNPKR